MNIHKNRHAFVCEWSRADVTKDVTDDAIALRRKADVVQAVHVKDVVTINLQSALKIEEVSFHFVCLWYLHTDFYLDDCQFVLLSDVSIVIIGSHNSDSF
jgi:hypothetical protein